MFCLDTRETDLIKILTPAVVKALPVADVWIGLNDEGTMMEGGLVIERKSIRDLEASVLDGRYRDQRARILSFCQEHKTHPLYVLEGSLSSSTGRLEKKAIMKIIHRLVFHYQIPVLQTASVQETAELVTTLIEQWKEDPASLQRTTELIKITDGIHVQKKANASDPKQFAIACLAQCPGVSIKMADTLIQHFGSLHAVIQAPVKDIEHVKVGARKVGPAVSQRLHDILTHQ
jgi:ERCC4-type nuclease